MNDWQQETQAGADGIRRRVLEHLLENNGGYMSQACSPAEMFAMLYSRVMNLGRSTAPLEPRLFASADYNRPRGSDLDRFIFSPAHYAQVLEGWRTGAWSMSGTAKRT